jgi:hypothetical protein
VENQWPHFPPCLLPTGNKETLSANHPPCLHICKAFSIHFLKARHFIKLNQKSEVQEKNLKTTSGSSYVLDLSTHINSSQVQTGATVSLRISGLLF